MIDNLESLHQRLQFLEERFADISYKSKNLIDSSIKRSFKIEAQAQTIYAPLVAYCISTIDPLKLNRVRVYHPLLVEPDVKVGDLPFARACSAQGGLDDSGCSWSAPAGSSVLIVCENGNRRAPIYLGTIWQKDRGINGSYFPYPIDEFFKLWKETDPLTGQQGYRNSGYLLGGTDGRQCYPPWDTENNNGINYDTAGDIDRDPDAQLKITYPNIYGWKTVGKHTVKMVDGDHRCNNRWARFEIRSKTGHMFIMKDDHYNPAGEWANPKGLMGFPTPTGVLDNSSCDQVSALLSLNVSGIENAEGDFTGLQSGQGASAAGSTGKCVIAKEPVKCSNPYYKRLEECRPYRGANNPQNNKIKLPQSGIQLQSLGGHQIIMDDSVNMPREEKISYMRDFNFGCDNICKSKFVFKSLTGQMIELSDKEDDPELRSEENGIKIVSATGHFLKMNDHTLKGCIAGDKRGVSIGSSSGHVWEMSDKGNEQCSPTRMEGGIPKPKAKNAFVQTRTGYGLIFRMDDSTSQEETRKQFIMLAATPKKVETDECNDQPHTLLMQLDNEGGGFVELSSGGKFVFASRKDSLESVGTDACKANKLTQVFGNYLMSAKDVFFSKSSTHLDLADKYIILGAGQDCDLNSDNAEQQGNEAIDATNQAVEDAGLTGESQETKKGPCIFPIIIAKDPQVCPFTGFIHWMTYSTRVFGSSN